MAKNGMLMALVGGGALVLLARSKASAAQPVPGGASAAKPPNDGGASPSPAATDDDWGDPGGGGGGGGSSPSSAPSSSASSAPGSSSAAPGDDDGGDEPGGGATASSVATAPSEKSLSQLDATEQAEALAAARMVAKQEAALEKQQALLAKATGKLQIKDPKPTAHSTPGKAMVTVPFSSMPAETSSSGASAARAKALAPATLANLNAKGANYDRKMLAAFQAAAGLKVDGLYGPASQAALIKAGATGAPRTLRKASAATTPKPTAAAPKPAAAPLKVTVSPATSKVDLAAAKKMAADVAANLRNKGKAGYDRKLLASFQTKAGITGDGLYGPLAVAALKYFRANAPAAFQAGSVKSYTPPA